MALAKRDIRSFNSALRIPYSAFRIPHSAFRIPHSALKGGVS